MFEVPREWVFVGQHTKDIACGYANMPRMTVELVTGAGSEAGAKSLAENLEQQTGIPHGVGPSIDLGRFVLDCKVRVSHQLDAVWGMVRPEILMARGGPIMNIYIQGDRNV